MLKQAYDLYSKEVVTLRKCYRRCVLDFIHSTQYHDDLDAWSKNEHQKNHRIVAGLLLKHEKMVRHFFDCESVDDESLARLLNEFYTLDPFRHDGNCDVAVKPTGPAKVMTPRQRIPEVLNTKKATGYFERARAVGLFDEDYNWQGSDTLLSCFCAGMSLALKLSTRERDGRPCISWKPFDSMFGITAKEGLRGTFKNIPDTNDPDGLTEIYDIFPELETYMLQE